MLVLKLSGIQLLIIGQMTEGEIVWLKKNPYLKFLVAKIAKQIYKLAKLRFIF